MRERLLALASALLALAAASPAAAAPPGCTLMKIADLPVTMVGLRPVVSAGINGADARFFIDTGATFSFLSPASAAKFGLKLEAVDPRLHFSGVSGEVNVHVTTVRTLTFLGVPFHDVDFLVGEHALGPVDGLIGQNVMGGPDVEYDLANGVVRLFHTKGCGDAQLAYWAPTGAGVGELPIENMDSEGRHIIGTATLNGVKLRVIFDSGAARSVLTIGGARRAGVKTDGPDVVQVGASSGMGARVVRTWIAPFRSFEIGGEQVKATRIRISDIELPSGDMLLGADFFLSHHIYVARSQSRVYFTYNGGPVFNLEQAGAVRTAASATAPVSVAAPATAASSPQAEATAQPTDAAGFARRGAVEMARHDYDAAVADYGRASELAPNDAENFFRRAEARLLNHQAIVAMADLDQALKLKPDYASALALRGTLRLAGKDEAGARSDFDAAMRADPNAAAGIAETYLRAGRFAEADAAASAYIAAHPRNEDLAPALDVRCRARAFTGQGLDQALKDCNDAMRYRPGQPQAYASRGLVLLRLGKNDQAIADFNEALRLLPRAAWALYGRGVAEARKGLKAQSDADLAAAAAIVPHIADEATKAGLAS